MHGRNLTLSNTIPTKDGYEFQGWSTASTCADAINKDYDAGAEYKENNSVTLYAVWEAIYKNEWVDGKKDSYEIKPSGTWGGFSAKLRITWKEEYNQYLNQSRVSIVNFEMYYPSAGGLGPFYVGGASGETDGIYINDEYVQPMSLVDGKTDFAWSSTAGWKPLNLKPRDYPWTSTEITHKADGTKSVPIKVVLDSTYQNLKFGAAYNNTTNITLTDLR